MIGLNEIKAALTKQLCRSFPERNVFTEDILQTETIGKPALPAFHLQLVPMGSVLAMGQDTKDKDVLVDITYMEETGAKNDVLYGIRDRLEEALGTGIRVNDRFLHIPSVGTSIADDQMHVTFHLEYNDSFPKPEQEQTVFEELEMSIERAD